jgi:hypothetical protein
MSESDPTDPKDPWGAPDAKAIQVPSKGVLLDALLRPGNDGPPAGSPLALLAKAKEKFSLNDFSSTYELAGQVLAKEPSNSQALQLREKSEKSLLSMLESKLGALTHVPQVKVNLSEVMWLNLDPRAGFLLSQIDGVVSYEEMFSLSGMSRLETARILVQLKEAGVIS